MPMMNEKEWSDAELAAAVRAYLRMLDREETKSAYSKKEVYRNLSTAYQRSEKAFEYRMQNISAVLDELGQPWIPGLKPAGNVGANVKERIVQLLQKFQKNGRWRRKKPNEAKYKQKLPALRDWLIAVARTQRQVTYAQVMDAFDIDRFSLRAAMDFLGHQSENFDEPIITALIVSKGTGRCSEGFASEFGIQDDEAERQKLYAFWTDRNHIVAPTLPSDSVEVRAAKFVSVESRPEQAAFRKRVFLACNGCCVITGCDVVGALDAAHKTGKDWRKHNGADDGYVLRKDLHALYDRGLIVIDENGQVKIDASVSYYAALNGRQVRYDTTIAA